MIYAQYGKTGKSTRGRKRQQKMNNRGPSAGQVVLIVVATMILVVVLLLAMSLEAEGNTAPTDTPRPTMPPGTPTYEVFLPLVTNESLTPTPTPRPTLVR